MVCRGGGREMDEERKRRRIQDYEKGAGECRGEAELGRRKIRD